MSAEIEMVVAPWDDHCLIATGWVAWDQGECTEENRGTFRIWHFDKPEDALYVLALSQELKAAREHQIRSSDGHKLTLSKLAAAEAKRDELERELEDIETLPGLKRALIAERRAVAAEERANRYQMQYEEECEVHGETRALLAQRDEALERDRILWNEGREEIDEIVVHGCTVHVEQMSDRHWWMAVYKGEGARRFVLDFSVLPGRRKAMTCTGYDDCVEGGPWVWGEDSEHESPAARDGEAP